MPPPNKPSISEIATPNNPIGTYHFEVIAKDNDNDPGHNSSENDWLESYAYRTITIYDDDESAPEINYIYTGDGTDGNPGEIIVHASDDSGLSVDPSVQILSTSSSTTNAPLDHE